jgi:hypothetical protein
LDAAVCEGETVECAKAREGIREATTINGITRVDMCMDAIVSTFSLSQHLF